MSTNGVGRVLGKILGEVKNLGWEGSSEWTQRFEDASLDFMFQDGIIKVEDEVVLPRSDHLIL